MVNTHWLIQPTGGGKLTVTGDATIDATGRGVITLGPVPPRGVWLVSRLTISCTGPTVPMPSVYAYEGTEHPSNLFDATWTGTQDVSDFGIPYELQDGDFLTFVWTGGTPGEVATARLIGAQSLVS